MYKFIGIIVLACGLLAVPLPAQAAIVFTANLTADQEVPPSASTATGFARFVLNDAMTELTYEIHIFGIDVTGLQTPGSALDNLASLHIHRAPSGANGPVVFGMIGPDNDLDDGPIITPFTSQVGGIITGAWDLLEGNAGNTLQNQLPFLFSGGLYLNVHTPQFPGGAIRGQITLAVPEPTSLVLLLLAGSGLTAAGIIRRRRMPIGSGA